MSKLSFKEAMEKAPMCRFFTTAGGRSDSCIKASEELFGKPFSNQLVMFYRKFGYLSFFGHEIYGIDPFDNSGVLAGNSIAWALSDRAAYGLPVDWLPIYDPGYGPMYYLDYSVLNSDEEPRIIEAEYSDGQYDVIRVVAEDFGDFLLELVDESLG